MFGSYPFRTIRGARSFSGRYCIGGSKRTSVQPELAMGNVRLFFDHLFFSLISVWVVLVVAYFGLAAASDAFSITEAPWLAVALWVGPSLLLAGYFTFRSIRNRPSDTIVYTRRES